MCGVAGVWGAGEPGCTAAAQVMIEEVKVAERVRDMVDGLREGSARRQFSYLNVAQKQAHRKGKREETER